MERRIVLVGKTGSGRSATGNTILKGRYFEVKTSPESVTIRCEVKTIGHITVIDTPGIFETMLNQSELRAEMDQCIRLSVPGPHVFLLVIRLGRFTDEEKNAVKWIQKNFGKEALRYTILLFTHTDQLGQRTLKDFLGESRDLRRLLKSCGNRYHGFNNNDPSPAQVESLMQKIDDIVLMNDGHCYTKEMYKEPQENDNVNEMFAFGFAATVSDLFYQD